MKKITLILFTLTLLLTPFQKVKADEGMWFLMYLGKNMEDMQKKGLQLTAEEIYSINNSSLKDAIVQFAGGCTAEIISDQGLVLTNHHCGYGAIAELSTPEHDYLTNGFWSKSKEEELKPENLKVRFFVRMDNVTDRILGLVNDEMSEDERETIIRKEIKKIEEENSEDGKYIVSVRSFFEGNEFYYFVYQDFQDVRLVGTPPESIGKFGGNTDNWEWPRHTGDFSIFRVYTDKDGNPADYSEDNIPLKPKHHLPVSLNGYQEGDFSMILGYPGRTNRWMPAQGVNQNIKFAYPAWVEGSRLAMDVYEKYMKADQKVNLDYASKYAGIANYWKNRQGMIVALKEHKTVKAKKKTEKQYTKWAKVEAPQEKGTVKTINNYYKKTNHQSKQQNYLFVLLRSSTFALAPAQLGGALMQYAGMDDEQRAEMRAELEPMIDGIFDEISIPLEQELYAKQLALYYKKGRKGGIAQYVETVGKENKGDFTQYINKAFAESILTDKAALISYLDNPDLKKIQGDELITLSNALVMRYRMKSKEESALQNSFDRSFRHLVKGLQDSKLSTIQYPDANSTLRLTYGEIIDLPLGNKVNDADFNYYTTLKGTIAKHVPGDDEFEAPQKLIDLYNAKDFGQYADKNGQMWVNFLSNHDITGGNSGSPVLNGKGELIGIAFDGNIEAMAGDVIFDPELQRTISVDIRYVMFIIDKYAGATNIIEEIDFVK